MMDTKNSRQQQPVQAEKNSGTAKNPFEDGLSVNDDIRQAGEALDKEQEFKEAQTERD